MNVLTKSLMCLPLFGAIAACSSSNPADTINNNGALGQQVQLKLTGIEPMSGQHYEGWILGSGGVTSTGRFNVEGDGIVAVDADGEVLASLSDSDTASFAVQEPMDSVTAFVLTIEPNGDSDPGPSTVHFLEGSLNNGIGVAKLQEAGAIGVSFLEATGQYLLATPSNGPATHNQGIWYVAGGAPALNLPELNQGFTYEGWIVDTSTGEAISTGTFDAVNLADSDGGGSSAGPNPTPAFPGQDFINPARVLNDGVHMAVISVEPVPDFDPAPFAIKILSGLIAQDAAVTTNFDLSNISNEESIQIEITLK